ncbi:MAG TPA: TAT-variant-translocated molybdopterin oxidoreductase [Verrucomicrobiae bacterium]|jgi:molybdopterin-containing oxidoreductase family iron-sulfur binding subunit
MKPILSNSPALSEAREKLKGLRGPKYWRSLEELADTARFREMLEREFPAGWWGGGEGLGRRDFLRVMGASLALAGLTSSCTKQPLQAIVPYIDQPAELVPGRPLYFATAMPFHGFGHGIVVTSWEGHPTKIEGNDSHPISLGGSNIFMQAALLDLYDPDRAQAVMHGDDASTWQNFLGALHGVMERQKGRRGAGLRILTETAASPALSAQMEELLAQYPEARWHVFDAVSRQNCHEGARLAFGKTVEAQYSFDKARVIVALDSDFLFAHPAALRHARQFADGRRVSAGSDAMNRLYVVEPTPTITGSAADHRWPMRSGRIGAFAAALAARLGAAGAPDDTEHASWLSAAAADLQANRGASIVIAGDSQPPAVHAWTHAMNEALGNFGKTVRFSEPKIPNTGSLSELAADLAAGKVEALFILGGNPVFSAPSDLEFAQRVAQAGFSAHLSADANETAASCQWHVPESHFLESWSDVRAIDGTISIVQPLVNPLYNTVSAHELLAAMLGSAETAGYDIIRKHWTGAENDWRQSVHDGVAAKTQSPFVEVKAARIAFNNSTQPAEAAGLELVFKPDPTLWDGRFANNGWLQELAKPMTKVTWENPALISPALAARNQLSNGDIVELKARGRTLGIPIWITPGQADDCVTLHFGNGRERVGGVGQGVGTNVFALRESANFHFEGGAELRKTGGSKMIASTQLFHNVQSAERQVLREGILAEYRKDPDFVQKSVEQPPEDETLYNAGEFAYAGPRWGMSIDLTTCIGCNACILACQSENNIPVVGREQVSKGRSMQWIRVDDYFRGNADAPAITHMPVPCMQCENAPCELVCPVGATLHDHEGLNLQVYNRCVGTRFCSNNCPYKVRRFNFLFFAKADYHTPSLKAMLNPEVTVRWRGVMEKCTYCIQRISAARIAAQEEDRPIPDGGVTPACAQACPARAIVFGDLSDPQSRASKLRRHSLRYSMLGELNTKPRTTYLAKLTNPNPALSEGAHA